MTNKLFAENPELIERFLRALAKGREFARRYKEPTMTMVSSIRLFHGSALDRLRMKACWRTTCFKDEILTRAELIKAANIPDPGKYYDYCLIRKVYAELKKLEADVVTRPCLDVLD